MNVATFIGVTLVVGAITIFAARPWLRAAGYCVLIVSIAALWWLSLGRPRPVLLRPPRGTVLSFHLDEPHGIDVLVKPDRGGVAVYWRLPWNEAAAASLERAERDAKKTGNNVHIGRGGADLGFDLTGKFGAKFYTQPWRRLPPKTRP